MTQDWEEVTGTVDTDERFSHTSGTLEYKGRIDMPSKTQESLSKQIEELANFLMKDYPEEIGKNGISEGAIEVAIRVLADQTKDITKQSEQPKWNSSMDEAPKDGTEVLICDDGEVIMAEWSKGHTVVEDEFFASHSVPYEGWYLGDDDGRSLWANEPTRWMLIPLIPKETDDDRE